MKITVEKKQLYTYLCCFVFILLSLIYLIIGTHKNAISAGEVSATGPLCGSYNNIVGYNIGGYGCSDAYKNLEWSVKNGAWITVLMNTHCTQPNTEIPIKDIVQQAKDNGSSVVVRLYPGSSIPKVEANMNVQIDAFVNCLNGIADVGGNVYVEPHNEVNMCREMSEYSCNLNEMASGMGRYLNILANKSSGVRSRGIKFLFPSMNMYPNSETFDPAQYNPIMMRNANLPGGFFSGVSIHVYGGNNVYLYDGNGGARLLNCASLVECTNYIYGGSIAGSGIVGSKFVTELGYIDGSPKYQDPETARFLANAWTSLQGTVTMATPFVYNPDLPLSSQCSSYKLANSEGMSQIVASATYNGCITSDDIGSINGMNDQEDLVKYLKDVKGLGGCDNCSFPYEKINCGLDCLCSSMWTCCNGHPAFGTSGVCLYPEWGGIIGKCRGGNVWKELKCSDTIDESMEGGGGADPENPPVTVSCNCDVRLSILPVTKAHQPWGMPGTMFVSVRERLGNLGHITCLLPGKCWNSNPADAENAPKAYWKTIMKISVDSKGGNFSLTAESGKNIADGAVEDEALSTFKIARWFYADDLPGNYTYDRQQKQVADLIDNACDGGFTPILTEGLEYCEIVNPFWAFDPVVKLWRDFWNGKCEVEVDKIAFYTEEVFRPLETATVRQMRTLTGLPGQTIKCEEPVEVATLAGASICGERHDVKLYFLGVARSVSCYGSAAASLAPPGSKIEESYMKYL